MSSFSRQQEHYEQHRSRHERTFPGLHPLVARNQPSQLPCCCCQPLASEPAQPCSHFIILIKLCRPKAVSAGFMPLVFTLCSGGDVLSAAFGCWGGTLHTAVLVSPSACLAAPPMSWCLITARLVTQLAGVCRAGGMGSLEAQVSLL